MADFLDNRDREWTLTIDVNSIRRVRADPGIDLMGVLDGPLLIRLASDPVLLVDTLYTLCAAQAETAKISPEEFGQGLTGDAIEKAGNALLEALADFFPSRRRAILRQLLERAEELAEKDLAAIEAKLAAGDVPEKPAAEPTEAPSPPAPPPGATSTSSPESPA